MNAWRIWASNDTAATTQELRVYLPAGTSLDRPYVGALAKPPVAEIRAQRESQYREWRQREKRK